jgi:hypothetical protein
MAAGQAGEAKEYIELGKKRPLLAEEKTLFDRVTVAAGSAVIPPRKPAPPEGTSLNSPVPEKQAPR